MWAIYTPKITPIGLCVLEYEAQISVLKMNRLSDKKSIRGRQCPNSVAKQQIVAKPVEHV